VTCALPPSLSVPPTEADLIGADDACACVAVYRRTGAVRRPRLPLLLDIIEPPNSSAPTPSAAAADSATATRPSSSDPSTAALLASLSAVAPYRRARSDYVHWHSTPEVHFAYAVTWFALAVLGAGLTFTRFRKPQNAIRVAAPAAGASAKQKS
jgi:hypothetical protein